MRDDFLAAATEARGGLTDHAVITVSGVDAEKFVHAQSANDVSALAVGDWQWNCCLTPQGRVSALFIVLRVAPGELLIVLPSATAEPWLADVRRYVLRSKVKLTVVGTWRLDGAIGADPATEIPHGGGSATASGGNWMLALGGRAGRQLLLSPVIDSPVPATIDAAWRIADIADGIPRIAGITAVEYTAHALGLQRFGAFSTSKGCYPGQEIIARTHFLGRNKRRPARFIGEEDAPPPGTRLTATPDGTDAAADVIDALLVGRAVTGLAILRGDAPVFLYWRDGDESREVRVVEDESPTALVHIPV